MLMSHDAQQVVPPPEVQVSAVGRQLSVLTVQRPPTHRLPQHSTFAVQFSLETLHSAPPQRPALHAKEQHSSARVQGAPSPKQALRHARWFEFGTGSQRAVQHAEAVVHGEPAGSHAPPVTGPPHTPPVQLSEQHSDGAAQAWLSGLQTSTPASFCTKGDPPAVAVPPALAEPPAAPVVPPAVALPPPAPPSVPMGTVPPH